MDHVTKIDISYTATAVERGRYEHNMKVLCISGEINTGPRRERPNWNEAVTKTETFAKEQWKREHIPIDQRQRMNDTQKLVQLFQRD